MHGRGYFVTDIQSLRAVYLSKTDGEPSRFHIWERGDPVGDSVTPSTYSGSYRIWMRDLLRKFLSEWETGPGGLLSIGCGNAAVEVGLVKEGHRVLGVDAMTEAVALAQAKGVDAVCADILTWTPPSADWSVAYADGFLGHVFDPDEGIRPALERIRSWLPEGAVLVISNDDPKTDSDTQTHTEVPQFTWLSGRYLQEQAEAAGFTEIWTTWFTYSRPVSGPRDRVIVTARV
ncbi:MAG: methyltransferase domain-containing protein [Streptosporangiales bacterium]|nr:methyltransferase domain-containing protein [Streptosporangiales bacterium]